MSWLGALLQVGRCQVRLKSFKASLGWGAVAVMSIETSPGAANDISSPCSHVCSCSTRLSSDPPSYPLRPHRALLTLAPFPLLIIRVAILRHLLSSVFRYVTSCQSCSSGNCDQEGIPLRILPFRKAQNRAPGGALWMAGAWRLAAWPSPRPSAP